MDGVIAVNVALIVAGSLGIFAAAVHGAAGEVLVVRKLTPEMLPRTRFGGPRMTRTMIHVTWHLTTVAFFSVGCALLLSGSVLDGDTARGVGLGAAGAATGFAAVTVGLGGSARALLRHPAPAILTASAALAWLGAL